MVTLHVNGRDYSYDGDPAVPLLRLLRAERGLTATKGGCGIGLCGACTVHIDGAAARSCLLTAEQASGKEVVTIEGLDPSGNGNHPVQIAWREANAPQCGYCHAGQIMNAAALLAKTPKPTQEEILAAQDGNICRCGCYQRINEAILLASAGV